SDCPTRSPSFPYTTLFRSRDKPELAVGREHDRTDRTASHLERRPTERDGARRVEREHLVRVRRIAIRRVRERHDTVPHGVRIRADRKSTRLNFRHSQISYA